jgi:hypothetical protein
MTKARSNFLADLMSATPLWMRALVIVDGLPRGFDSSFSGPYLVIVIHEVRIRTRFCVAELLFGFLGMLESLDRQILPQLLTHGT